MSLKVAVVLACLAVLYVEAAPGHATSWNNNNLHMTGHDGHGHGHGHYDFHYGVHDGHTKDIKEQKEEKHGDVIKGSYSLLEADGTKRVVEYVADKHNGFNAVVKRIGHAVHPYHHSHH